MSAKPNKISGRRGFIGYKAYREFKKKHPNETVSYEEYIKILKTSTQCIRDHILDNPLGFKLPYNLGYIAVDKFKALNHYVSVDWVATKKLGKRVPLTNLHSFGHMFTIKLYPNPRKKPLLVYKMTAHRIINRLLAKRIKEGKEYLEIDRTYFSKRFRIGEHIKYNYG